MAPLRNDLSAFHEVLRGSKRILALCGAGLSAASGLPTFRGAGGLWRGFKSQDLATEDAFEDDPGMVWLFYSYRRHTALKAKPNAGHYALAELAKKVPGFMCLSQNVDGKDRNHMFGVEAGGVERGDACNAPPCPHSRPTSMP